MWMIDDKNKRKDKDSSARHRKQWIRAPISNETRSHYMTPRNLAMLTGSHYSWTNDDQQQPFDDACTEPRDQLISAQAIQTRNIPRSRSSPQQLQRQRLISAVANWYNHLMSLDNITRNGHLQNSDTTLLFEKLASGLEVVRTNVTAGTRLLREAGLEVSAMLQNPDPTIALRLLDNLSAWQTDLEENEIDKQYVSLIHRLLIQTSREDLGYEHPLSLLITTLGCGRMDAELSDMLCEAIELNYSRKLRDEKLATSKSFFRRIFGVLLVTQERYLDVEDWFEKYAGDRDFLNPSVYDDVWALGTLATSRLLRGSYSEAGNALSQAMDYVEKNDLRHTKVACHIIGLSAWLKWSVYDIASCEQLRQEQLRIAQILGEEFEIVCSLAGMWEFYRDCGRLDMAARFLDSYPEILASISK